MILPDLTKDRKDISWLWPRTLFLTAHGSHAYGTNLPTSDRDYKGFGVAPARYYLGYAKRWEQAEFKGDPDMVVYNINKFFTLAADCNPSIIEVLFTDPSDHQIVHPLGQKVLAARELFISKKAKHTFSGYAVSQLKKIKSHKKWIMNPPVAPPTREEFGLPERTVIPQDQLLAAQAMIRKQIDHWNVPVDELDPAAKIAVQERFVEALTLIETGARAQLLASLEKVGSTLLADDFGNGFREAIETVRRLGGANLERISGNLLGFSDNFLELLDKERQYKGRMEEWRSYQTWLATRNEKRSELERKWGYDSKHGSHLVRLMRMGVEILKGEGVKVKRPDAEELLAIRSGAWTYDQLLEWAEAREKEMNELYFTSTIPKSPDVVTLDKLLVEIVQEALETLP